MTSSPPPGGPARDNRRHPAWWLLFALTAVTLFGFQLYPLGDPDLYVHMRDGQYWAEQGLRFPADPFAYTIPDKPIDRIEVLFCLLVHGLWSWGGWPLVLAVRILSLGLVLGWLGLLMHRRWPNLIPVALLLLVFTTTPSLFQYFRTRPYLFTYVLLLGTFYLLERYRAAAKADPVRSWCWLLPLPLCAPLAANLHPGFVLIFIPLGALMLEAAWRGFQGQDPLFSRMFWSLGATSAAILAAGALNPLGFGLYTYIIEHLGAEAFSRYIIEWNPPTFTANADFYVFFALAWCGLILGRRALRPADWISAVVFSVMAWQAVRNIPLFFFGVLPPLAGALRAVTSGALKGRPLAGVWLHRGHILTAAVMVLALGLGAGAGAVPKIEPLQGYFPSAAMDWYLDQRLAGRNFAPLRWGGYIGWRSHGKVPIFIDGRLMLYEGEIMTDYIRLVTGEKRAVPALLDAHEVETLLYFTHDPTGNRNHLRVCPRLKDSHRWSLVYWDDVALVFVRRDGLNAGLAADHAYTAVAPWQPEPYHLDLRRPGILIAELERAVRNAPRSHLPSHYLGEAHFQLGDLDAAREAFTQALDIKPDYAVAHYNLGLIAFREQRYDRAEQHLRASLRHAGGDADPQIGRLLEEVRRRKHRTD